MPSNPTGRPWEDALGSIRLSAEGVSTAANMLEAIVSNYGSGASWKKPVQGQITQLRDLRRKLSEDVDEIAALKESEIEALNAKNVQLKKIHEGKLAEQRSELETLKAIFDSQTKPRKDDASKSRTPMPDPKQTPNANEPIKSLAESVAANLTEDGRKAFNERKYSDAETQFRDARSSILNLPPEAQKRFNLDEIAYYLAVCAALDPKLDIAAKQKKLTKFLETPRSADGAKRLQIAHANHLLAQLYVQLGDYDNAMKCCEKAFEQTAELPAPSQFHHETKALSMRILQLQKKGSGVIDGIANRFPDEWRDWFVGKYSSLRKIGEQNTNATPLRSQPPNGILRAPTWTVPQQRATEKGSDPRPKPKTPKAEDETVDKTTRELWLRELGFADIHLSYKEAIVKGDVTEVRSQLTTRRSKAQALHLAALFGEAEIVKVLIEAGCAVNESCKLNKLTLQAERPNGLSLSVTPMHLAIATRQTKMIELLASYKASLGVPSDSKASKDANAPPRFLVASGWMRMIGRNDVDEVMCVVDTLRKLEKPWNITAGLNQKGWTILDFADMIESPDARFKDKVIAELKKLGARRER